MKKLMYCMEYMYECMGPSCRYVERYTKTQGHNIRCPKCGGRMIRRSG
jgi:hypothetical protein